jgi:uncharacterized membrane protein YsdA (DUF1294 family)
MIMIEQIMLNARQLPWLNVLLYFVVVNGLTFMMYRYDKIAAIERRWRTPESTLHMLMLCGGTFGAFAAQRILRHKNRKRPFQVVFWLLVAIQCVALIMMFARTI